MFSVIIIIVKVPIDTQVYNKFVLIMISLSLLLYSNTYVICNCLSLLLVVASICYCWWHAAETWITNFSSNLARTELHLLLALVWPTVSSVVAGVVFVGACLRLLRKRCWWSNKNAARANAARRRSRQKRCKVHHVATAAFTKLHVPQTAHKSN